VTSFRNDRPRRVIPRWHSVRLALSQGELDSLRVAGSPSPDARIELERLRTEWLETEALSAAADLVGAAPVIGDVEETADAARALVSAPQVPRLTLVAARDWLAGAAVPALGMSPEEAAAALLPKAAKERAQEAIRRLKRAVRRDPRQALVWAELARQYESLGQRPLAAHAMDIALVTAPDSRFILRSASRLAVHHEDPEKAHDIIVRSPRTQADPWLMSAEIALSSLIDKRSRLLKRGQSIVEADAFSPTDIAELATALGTLQLEAAKGKQAKRLFAKALIDPTENAVAQVEWAATRMGGIVLPTEHLEAPESYEARAIRYSEDGDWRQAVGNCWLWLATLPFSAAPATLGSHQAAIGGAFEQGAAIAEAGLLANPDEFMLRNNLAYCLLELDETEAAMNELAEMERLPRSDIEELVFSATRGLLAFRSGAPDEGRALYREAISAARDPGLRAVAAIELALEELRGRTPFAAETARVAEEIAAAPAVGIQAASIKILLERLRATRATELA
jgi:tetratricopeptide (TPR) repeat protein